MDFRRHLVIITVAFQFLNQGTCLSCFHCQSKNESECLSQQAVISCKHSHKACITLSYRSVLDTPDGKIYESVFRKKCVTGNVNCLWYCRSQLTMGDKHCYAACCTTSKCNNKVDLSRITLSHSSTIHSFSLLTIFSLLFCYLF